MKQALNSFSQQQALETARWLKLAILALAIAGLFALLLVISRVPGMEQLFPWIDFFQTALVIHVNQSVLVWFLAFAGVICSIANQPQFAGSMISRLAFWVSLIGTLGIAVSAFSDQAYPLLNNYIPVLQHPLFFLSLGFFACGLMLRIGQYAIGLFRKMPVRQAMGPIYSVALSVSIIIIIAMVSLAWTGLHMPAEMHGELYFEYLFWGAGHTLQFAYTQMMLLGWILLALMSGVRVPLGQQGLGLLLLTGLIPALFVIFIYAQYPAVSAEMRVAFTRLMQFGGGIPAVPIGLLILFSLWRTQPVKDDQQVLRLCLWMSILLFAAGGIIALLIKGVNTIIPAHYHGSIVGVTLSLMGLAYLLLPYLGYPKVAGRLAKAQPILYGGGQLLHICGLAMAGALGIQRKTAGSAQGLDSLTAKLTMGLMGIGGLMAVAGGILFVVIMLRSFMRPDFSNSLNKRPSRTSFRVSAEPDSDRAEES